MRQLMKLVNEAPIDDLGALFAQYNQAVEDALRPSDYLGGFQIEMEHRTFGPASLAARERELEATLEMPVDVPTVAIQMSLL
jgi:hypothetical protein